MKKPVYLLTVILLLSSCSKMDKMLLAWKYRSEYKVLVNKAKIKHYTSPKATTNDEEKAVTAPENLSSSTQVDYNNLPVATKNPLKTDIEEKKKEDKTSNMPEVKENTGLSKKEIKNIKSILQQKYQTPDDRKTSGLAIAGFVLGIVGLIIAGVLLGTLAFIFGIISVGKTGPDKPKKGQGFAIAAIVLGLVAVIGALIVIASMNK